ncbi:ABC transporter family substrate-binding protein [Cryobacterium sp. TMT1-3]|uniref:ABC transporter family substrate-binding protein n=1 Tax=Cryobacterium luteum TaxID=1424661 RepID=A0A1H8DYM1_9MICO|nr:MULTISPECIES: ABC transporter family substrate-binding protein [Cryobacterium]TFB89762.1 ABC transporter family substrate-binding protein [Cryobacterium luteum]TFC25474.1 ABC transporter family substrate-binding protein [Cryobacterium sp. TMT1-3]SEN12362.1 peptide/nickel transport system substrate-binding protein [Cryobacterium luteum]
MSIRGKLFRKSLSGVAVLGVAALALTACTTTGSTDDNTDAASGGGTVTVAIVNDFTSFNNQTPQANLDTNGIIGYLMGNYGSAFAYIDPDFNLVREEEFGTFEKTSDDPQTVTYTLNPDNKWSDGEPVTADDMVLSWATQSGYFNSATKDENDEVVTGTQYFDLAASTAGLDTTALPTVSDDNLSMTLVYGTPFVDWEIVNPIGQPAHIVAKKAGLGSAAELTELIMSLPKGDPASPAAADPTFKAAADFVNTGYDVTAFPTDPDLLVSSGPMVPTGWTPGQSFTMEPNEFYVAGMKPKIDKLILRVIPDANAEVTALQNGEVDIMYPQASADTLTALENTGADVLTGDQLSYDHVDLNFGSEVFADLKVRQAFLKTIPRQQILDSLITPINPDAEVLNSQIWVPANEPYDDSVANNGSSDYAEVDIEGAKALLAGATPTVSILYNSNNPNRVDSFQAIQESASQAGFTIVDKGSPDWSSLLSGGDYEASIFGWISPGVGSAGISQIFSTDGGGNYSRYTGTNDDALLTQTTLDPDEVIAIEKRMDKQMFADAYGLPLFQLPGVYGVSKRVSGVEYMGNQTGPFWNFWQWSVNE